MRQLSIDRTISLQTAAVAALTTASLVLLALVAAHWTWQWLVPRLEAPAQPAASVSDHRAAANVLFGKPLAAPAGTASTTTAISLLVIVAATTGNRGYIVARTGAKEVITVREGDEVVPGIRLAGIATDHVILERGGTRETLTWPIRSTTVDASAPPIRR